MVQPFLESVTTEGEYSFLFFDGEFSHCALKRPAAGDYRVQSLYGGREVMHEPSEHEIAACKLVLAAARERLLYARVDMVRYADELALIELEVVEPYLYPEQGPQLGERFEQLARQRADTDVAGQLLIEAHPDTMVQDVVDLWQIAAQHGFERPLFGGMGNRPLPDETQQLLQSLPKRFDWPSENRGPGGSIKVQGGELLFLLDGPTRWGDFLPLYAHCAQVGIWRLGLVCQQDRARRSKWSVPLPFDRGL